MLAVAATYMGTVVGAGFASGQEVLRFFTCFGERGSWGLMLATPLLVVGGAGFMELGRRTGARSYAEALRILAGSRLGGLLDALTTVFLFTGLAVMAAGSGALFHEQLGLPAWVGQAILLMGTLGTVLFGLQGVVAANGVVVPFLISAVMLVTLHEMWRHSSPGWQGWEGGTAAHRFWPVAALLYASYNLFLSLGVLVPLGSDLGRRNTLAGGVLGGLGLGVTAYAIHLSVLRYLPGAAFLGIPMLLVAASLPGWARTAYVLVLFAEVYTTAVANLFALSRRRAWSGGLRLTVPVIAAMLLSQLGFARLVMTFYPLAGWVGLWLLLSLPRALLCRRP